MWTSLTLPNDAASSQDAPTGMDIELHAVWVTFLLSTPHWFFASQNLRTDSPILISITACTCCPWRKHTCIWSLWYSLTLSPILGPKALNDGGCLVACPTNLYYIRVALISGVNISSQNSNVGRGWARKSLPTVEELAAADGFWWMTNCCPLGMFQIVTAHTPAGGWTPMHSVNCAQGFINNIRQIGPEAGREMGWVLYRELEVGIGGWIWAKCILKCMKTLEHE